jgi:ABC-2 type transport system permease protein
VPELARGRAVTITLSFLAICMVVVWWIFKTGYRLKN